jgi:uncharacterized protein with GYD domain
MPHFVTLISFNEAGLKTIADGPARLDAARARFRESGAEVKHFYLTSGRFDAIAVIEAPDQMTVARVLLKDTQMGTSRTETLFAFSEDEYRELARSLK